METEGQYQCVTCGDGLNIIGIIQHDCERILGAETLSQGERSTLLYIESRMVDQGGELDLDQMNYDDQQNLKLFGAAGILDAAETDPMLDHGGMEVVKFTDRAWELAMACRKKRAEQHLDNPDAVLESEGVN